MCGTISATQQQGGPAVILAGEIMLERSSSELPTPSAPAKDKTKSASEPSAWSDLGRSLAYGFAQSPITGGSQRVDHLIGTHLAEKFDFIEAPQPVDMYEKPGRWLAQQVGYGVGMLPWFLTVGKLTKSALGLKSEAVFASDVASVSSSSAIKHAAATGFAYNFALAPVAPDATDFWTTAAKQGITGAATFGTLSAAGMGLGYITKDIAGMTGKVLRNPFVSGAVAGIPAGNVGADVGALLTEGRLANREERAESIAGMVTVGAAMPYVQKGMSVGADRINLAVGRGISIEDYAKYQRTRGNDMGLLPDNLRDYRVQAGKSILDESIDPGKRMIYLPKADSDFGKILSLGDANSFVRQTHPEAVRQWPYLKEQVIKSMTPGELARQTTAASEAVLENPWLKESPIRNANRNRQTAAQLVNLGFTADRSLNKFDLQTIAAGADRDPVRLNNLRTAADRDPSNLRKAIAGWEAVPELTVYSAIELGKQSALVRGVAAREKMWSPMLAVESEEALWQRRPVLRYAVEHRFADMPLEQRQVLLSALDRVQNSAKDAHDPTSTVRALDGKALWDAFQYHEGNRYLPSIEADHANQHPARYSSFGLSTDTFNALTKAYRLSSIFGQDWPKFVAIAEQSAQTTKSGRPSIDSKLYFDTLYGLPLGSPKNLEGLKTWIFTNESELQRMPGSLEGLSNVGFHWPNLNETVRQNKANALIPMLDKINRGTRNRLVPDDGTMSGSRLRIQSAYDTVNAGFRIDQMTLPEYQALQAAFAKNYTFKDFPFDYSYVKIKPLDLATRTKMLTDVLSAPNDTNR